MWAFILSGYATVNLRPISEKGFVYEYVYQCMCAYTVFIRTFPGSSKLCPVSYNVNIFSLVDAFFLTLIKVEEALL